MPDDIVIDGSPVRADDVSGSFYQVVKLDVGGDGLSTPVVGSVPITVSSDPTQGTDGAVVPSKTNTVGGVDGSGNLQTVKVDTAGIVQVAQNGAVTIATDGVSVFKIQTDDLNSSTALVNPAAYSGAQTSVDVQNDRWRGARLFLNVTAAPTSTTETLTVSLEAKDNVSGNYFKVSNFTALPAANNVAFSALPATFVFEFYPGATNPTITNYQVQSNVLPYKFRAKVTHSAASSWAYSLGAGLLK